ncbi:Transferase family protein [Colletotrichum karsti]|uniref:Transferase family protein n=1 Tax=Colletotrichum karsti TaxID=1095194 RepID=A0A9P6LPG0_9PEZI|nr:Transferase family protein [Colletotrichum karsti]KAF9880366.1 Transferase family protein [Colletotrichum karsti]
MTGRLSLNEEDGSTEINRLGTGAELLSAVCDSRLPQDRVQLNLEDMPEEGSTLLPEYDGTPEEFSKQPILRIQHTRFGCGSVSLGVRVSHSVCDARGFLQLVEDLAEIYRGLISATPWETPLSDVFLQKPPCINSYLAGVKMSTEEGKKALNFRPDDYGVDQQPKLETFTSDKPVTGRLLLFSRKELDAIKAAASDSHQHRWASTFEALSAHLWLSVQRARKRYEESNTTNGTARQSEETADLLTSLDWRSSERLGLPPRYFPNAVSEPYVTASLNNLSEASLPRTAQIIHDGLRERILADQKDTLLWVAAQPDKRKISLRFRFNDKSFIVSQWNKLEIYGVCFDTDGQGRHMYPDRVWPPFTVASLADGLAYFLPTRTQNDGGAGGGDIEVALSLHEPLWDILEEDGYLRRFS